MEKILILFATLAMCYVATSAISCQTCNGIAKANCTETKTDCTTVTTFGANKTFDQCFALTVKRDDNTTFYLQSCAVKAECTGLCTYFDTTNSTALASYNLFGKIASGTCTATCSDEVTPAPTNATAKPTTVKPTNGAAYLSGFALPIVMFLVALY